MTDPYDEMRVAPDPSQAEALRQRLHARLATTSRDDRKDQSHHHAGAPLRLQPDLGQLKEIDVSEDSPTHGRRNGRRLALAAAGVVAIVGVAGIAVAVGTSSGDDETASPAAATTVAPTTSVAPVTAELPGDETVMEPVEFTACLPSNRDLRGGTVQFVPLAGQDGSLAQERGQIYVGEITSTDERLAGTNFLTWEADRYPSGLEVKGIGHRIENDDGAWQGLTINLTTQDWAPAVLVGEGAYEGLTAIATFADDQDGCFWSYHGYIVSTPAPFEPYSGE